jgi:subtilase family serine protease
MRFNVTYDKLELVVDAQYIDDSFEHAFGTQYQGYYEVNALFYNGTMIPLALISEETLDYLETEVNK